MVSISSDVADAAAAAATGVGAKAAVVADGVSPEGVGAKAPAGNVARSESQECLKNEGRPRLEPPWSFQ